VERSDPEDGDSFSGRRCSTGTMNHKLVLLSVFLTGCQGLLGSGNVVTTEREIGSFRKVSIASGIAAKASTGTRALSIRTDDNLQVLVETFVQDDTLMVRLPPNTFGGLGRIVATISNDVFEGVHASGGSSVSMTPTPISHFSASASGGSRIELSGLSSDDFSVDASGGSTVIVDGNASRAEASASGGSTVRLTGVPLESLDVHASGASTVNARVSSSVTGSASGASTVSIVGRPSSNVERSGASQVILGAQ
jgi:hypothetical protein